MKFLSDILAKAGLVVDGTVTLNSVANATTDTDRFIVVDSGVVKYRTGTQLLSDIGGISGNQSITLSGDATGSGTTAIAVTLANSGVAAATYGSASAVPVITVDAKGRVTNVTTASISGSLTFTGDVTGSGTTGTTTTLTLANSGVVAGTYTKVTVDAKGRVTTGASLLAADIPALNYLPIGGGTLTGNVIVWPGSNASYGAGFKFRNDTYAHYSIGVKGSSFVLSNTGSDGTVVWPVSITDLITVGTSGNTVIAGTVTASSIIKSGGTSSQFLKADGSVDSTTYQSTSQKGQANGYASLDGAGKVPVAQLPSSIMEYKGTWNASTNSPSLADGTGDTGDVYRVSTAGTRNLGSGSITFDVGDYVIYNGTIWEKSDTTDAVASVNGFTGVITLTTTNIGEGTNLYYTDARARAAITLTTTGTSGAATYSGGVLNIPQYQPAGSYLTAESDTLATVTNRGNSTVQTLFIDQTTGGGYVFRTSSAWGGWARHAFSIADGSNNILSTIGGYGGSGTSISFMYIGKSYTDFSAAFNPDGNVEFRYDNSTRLTIDSVGISVSGRTTSGWGQFSSSTQGTPIVKAIQEDSSTGYYLFQGVTGSTEMFRVDRTGAAYFANKLSVGTTYAGFALNLAGTAYVIGGHVWVNDGYGYANATSVNTGLFPDSSHNLNFKSNNDTAIYVSSSKYVGINTTSPDRLLTIAPASGDAYINLKRPVAASTQATLEFNTAGTNDWLIRTDDASANLKFYSYGTSGYALILARSTGAATFSSSVTASSLIKSGGTSAQFLMADGSVSTNPGWITGYTETDTLATVTNRGNTTTGRINVRGIGNQSGGNILMGNTGNASNKWSYLTGAHYNADSQPQGFALIGGLSTDTYNAVVIGGNIYETNPATEIQFWTHNATTHNLGGTQRGVINSAGNWGIGALSPGQTLHVYNGNGNLGYKTARFDSNDTGNGTRVLITNSGNTSNRGYAFVTGGSGGVGPGADNFSIGYYNADSTFITQNIFNITSSGFVGINTLSAYIDSNDKFVVAGGRLAVNVGAFNPAAFNRSNGGSIVDLLIGGYGKGYIGSNGTDITLVSYANLLVTATSVGIGTATPSSILDASVSSGATSGFRFKGWSDASTPYLLSLGTQTYQDIFQIKSVNGLVTMGIVGAIGSTPDLVIQTNSTERIRITSVGSTGIGTASPGTAKLYVRGQGTGGFNTIFEDNTSPYCWLQVKASGGGSNSSWQLGSYNNGFNFYNDNNSAYRVFFGDNGNVGIGTTTPGAKLEVVNGDIWLNAASSGVNPEIRFIDDSGISVAGAKIRYGNADGNLYIEHIWDTTTSGIFFRNRTGGTALNTLSLVNGNVGINTTSPSAKLHVEGTFINNGTTGDVAYISSTFATAATNGRILHIRDNKATVSVDSYVSVGWTSSPGQDVYIGKRTTSGAGFLAIQNSSATELFTINLSSGNAGIQVSNPTNKLQIGSVGSSGYGGNDLAIGNGTQVMAFYQSSTVSTWYTNTNFSLMPSGAGGVGNLAVGTATASNRLTVSGSADITNALFIGYTGAEYGEKLRVNGGVTTYHAYTQSGTLSRVGNVSQLITTTAGGAGYYGGLTYTAFTGAHDNTFNGSVTIPNSVGAGGINATTGIRFGAANVTVTMTQSGSLRSYDGVSSGIAPSATATGGSISHVSAFHALAPYYVGSNTPTITNYFGLLLNDSAEYSTWVAITNRWGIYQHGSGDNNYFAGKVMVGTTTVPTQLMYVNGTSYFNGNMTVNGTITELSTINIKTNVETLDGALDKVEKMRGVSYNRKDNHKKEIGFIAEEVDEVYPEFVEYDEQGNPVGLHYARLTAVLLQSVKELSSRIKELEKRN